MKEPTCYENPDNPSSISNFHKLVVKVLKTFYKKQTPKIIHYRNYKNFEKGNFRQELKKELMTFVLQVPHYQILMTLFYMFLTSTLQNIWNIYVQAIAILWLKNWEKQLWTDQ